VFFAIQNANKVRFPVLPIVGGDQKWIFLTKGKSNRAV
jgi:hypothetical protein